MVELILVIGYIIVTTAIGWILSTRAKARNDINSFFVGKKNSARFSSASSCSVR